MGTDKFQLIAVCLVTAVLLFYRLDDNYLSHWDEAWYGDISRTMLRKGSYFTPVWNGHPFFEKPPLFYWVSALSMKIFGVNEWSIRAISAISGVGTVLVTYLLAERLFRSPATSLISSVVLVSTIAFLYRSRTGNIDTFLTFWLTLSVYVIYAQRRGLLVISLIAAFLTKWFIAFLFPIFYILWNRNSAKYVAVVLTLGIGWIIAYAVVFGEPFIDQFIFSQIGKVAPGVFSFDYVSYLKSGLKLWFILAVPALYLLRRHLISIYIFLVIFGLSFSANKSDWFLLPLYPLIAIVIGKMMARWRWGVIAALAIAAFQITYYKSLYITPDTASDDAALALAAKERTDSEDLLYVTNYAIPTIVFYSQRQTFAVYGNRRDPLSPWILPEEDWQVIKEEPRVFVVTNFGELEALKKNLLPYDTDILFASGDKILVAKKI